jgi:hypothetical protein
MNINSNENDYKVLIDALKYTSDIIVSLTEKMSNHEDKILLLEKYIHESKNDNIKNEKKINDLTKKILELSNILTNFNNNINFDIVTQVDRDINSTTEIETINNTLCNTNAVSDVTSINIDDITNLKNLKASNLVKNLIKQKLELDKKNDEINKTMNNEITKENDNKNINNFRRKKNFANRF